MTSRSFVLIGNPQAGRGHAARSVKEVAAHLRAAGAQVREEMTTSITQAAELAASTDPDQVAVAVGGDGLVRAVAKGASRYGGTIGVVPAGRGNDFARTIGIRAIAHSVRVLLDGASQRTDCISVSGENPRGETVVDVALGNVYVGFDSLTNIAANRARLPLGHLTYTVAAVRVALTMPPHRFRLLIDGVPRDYLGSGVAVANSVYYGGGVPVAPAADLHDGLLEVIMFEQTDRRSRVAALLAMRHGKHQDRADVQHTRAREIVVEVAPAIDAYSDGDLMICTPLTVRVMPGAIGLLRS